MIELVLFLNFMTVVCTWKNKPYFYDNSMLKFNIEHKINVQKYIQVAVNQLN